ncbi:hypothetical protein HNQ91_001424 [Filimonas zeae]|uniref:hypothetical protein n=1 Tax=Filimonas zeae TaxID=1737353 RepID=UPI00166CF0D7|nr:hypothetical protein [Filimonas zeae]MDR6338373.1 hypothetical protein [Filimonas zeae]
MEAFFYAPAYKLINCTAQLGGEKKKWPFFGLFEIILGGMKNNPTFAIQIAK